MSRRLAALLTVALMGGGVVAACGGSNNGGGGNSGGGGGGGNTAQVQGAKVIDPKSMDNAKGDVTLCMGKDTSGDKTALVKQFNSQNPGITAKLLEFSTSADEQRAQFVQRQEAKSGECDVFYSDVIWTAGFAGQK